MIDGVGFVPQGLEGLAVGDGKGEFKIVVTGAFETGEDVFGSAGGEIGKHMSKVGEHSGGENCVFAGQLVGDFHGEAEKGRYG